MERLRTKPLGKQHERLVPAQEGCEAHKSFSPRPWHPHSWQSLNGIPRTEAAWRKAVPYLISTGTQVARQCCKSETATNVTAKVDDEAVASLLFQISNTTAQLIAEANAKCAWKIHHFEKTDSQSQGSMHNADRLDDRG